LLRIIYSTAVKYGGKKEFDTVLSVYRKPPTPQHKVTALYCLTRTKDETLLGRTFDFLLSGEVREHDIMYPVMASRMRNALFFFFLLPSPLFSKDLIFVFLFRAWPPIAVRGGECGIS
jgi:hypothetical protein